MTKTHNNNSNSKPKRKKKKKPKQQQSKIGTKANTTQWHLPYILFGGRATFVTSSGKREEIHFRNAFSEGLSYRHLKRAMEKTGYYPNTRCLLESTKLRHEVFENDNKKTPRQIMIEQFDKQNKEDVAFLKSRGYDLVDNLRIPIKKVTKEEQEERECKESTKPNTKERRGRIIFIRKTAGAWFKATGGGCCMNGDDPIIAFEAERRLLIKESLEKKKTEYKQRDTQIKAEKKIIQEKGNNISDWNIPDLRQMIKYKDPLQAISNKNRPTLEKLWKKVKNMPQLENPNIDQWTEKNEEDYNDLLADGKKDISIFHVMRKAEARSMLTITEQVKSIHLGDNRVKVLSTALQNLDESKREEILNNWDDHNINDEYELLETSSMSSIEEDTQPRLQQQQQRLQTDHIFLLSDEDSSNSNRSDKKEEGDDVWNSDETKSSDEESSTDPQGSAFFSSDDNDKEGDSDTERSKEEIMVCMM